MDGEADAGEIEYRRRLGATIVELRRLRGMSQVQLADRLGRSTAALSRWETGRTMPSAWDLRCLAGLLDAPADLLLRPPAAPESPVVEILRRHDGRS